jgi:hypothetical protein
MNWPPGGVTSAPAGEHGFAELVLKLADLFLHTRKRVVHQCRFMLKRGDEIGQFLLFNQRGAGQIFFIFTQRQLGFFLPFIELRGGLLNTTCQLFFSASARADVERTSTSVSSIS